MSAIRISATVTNPVALTSDANNVVDITGSGVVNVGAPGGIALYSVPGVRGTITNDGTVRAGNGTAIALQTGGAVTNGGAGDTAATIFGGRYGVLVQVAGPAIIGNWGTIASAGFGVALRGGGGIVNGGAGDEVARIGGQIAVDTSGEHASVANYATITGASGSGIGIYMHMGGTVVNGSAADVHALIAGGYDGIEATLGFAAVTNFGTIRNVNANAVSGSAGLALQGGASVVNGSVSDTAALIQGMSNHGIYIRGPGRSTVTNFGTVTAAPALAQSEAVYIRDGGVVINGAPGDHAALISAAGRGVAIGGNLAARTVNFGTIIGEAGIGVEIYAGGTVVNGDGGDTRALIRGMQGVFLVGSAGSTLANFGTVAVTSARAGGVAASLYDGGLVTNGSAGDRAAWIDGGDAGVVMIAGASSIVNYATITGTIGVSFIHGSGRAPVTLAASGTVVDWGTIASTAGVDGTAIRFGVGPERLVLEAGARIVGRVLGGSGSNTLELGAGTDQVAGFGSSFTNFGTITVDAGGHWTLTGNPDLSHVVVTGPGTLISNGTIVHGALKWGAATPAPHGGGTTVAGLNTAGVAIFAAAQNPVFITPTGTIIARQATQTSAVYVSRDLAGTMTNLGTLAAPTGAGAGAVFTSGGTIVNGGPTSTRAAISGAMYGVQFGRLLDGDVTNFGTISSPDLAVQFGAGGTLVNGSSGDHAARIIGGRSSFIAIGGTADVHNYGTMAATTHGASGTGYGIYLRSGGTIINGAESDTSASIYGFKRGIFATINRSSVANFGTIAARDAQGSAIVISGGGAIVNGSVHDTAALIAAGGEGAVVRGLTAGTVANYGTIAVSGPSGNAVSLLPSGTVVNGAPSDTVATLRARNTTIVALGPNATTVTNFATIVSSQAIAVNLYDGGRITNGTAQDRAAVIQGLRPVLLGAGQPGTLINYGTIAANRGANFASIDFNSGGVLQNNGVIGGGHGVVMTGGVSTLDNLGTISGTSGVFFTAYKSLGHHTWNGSGTIINAGTIIGTRGIAVQFGVGGTQRLVVDPGAVFVGRVIGGTTLNSVVELAAGGGAGTLSGLGTEIRSVGTVLVDAGTAWTLAGANTIAAGTTLAAMSGVTLAGSLRDYGTLRGTLHMAAGGTLTQAGVVAGALRLDAGSLLQIGARSALSGGITLGAGTSVEMLAGSTGTLRGLDGQGRASILTNHASDAVSGLGSTIIDAGARWLLAGANTIGAAGGISLQGTLATAGPTTIAAGGSLLASGRGAVAMFAHGLILAGGTLALAGGAEASVGTTATGERNALTVEAGSFLAGYGTISAALRADGTVIARGGTLAIGGNVAGSGAITIAAGAALVVAGGLGGRSTVFARGGNETLTLGARTGNTSVIAGFGLGDIIDIRNVAAVGLTFAGGNLSLFDAGGGRLATLKLAGPYSAASFSLRTDHAGGTEIVAIGIATPPGANSTPSFGAVQAGGSYPSAWSGGASYWSHAAAGALHPIASTQGWS